MKSLRTFSKANVCGMKRCSQAFWLHMYVQHSENYNIDHTKNSLQVLDTKQKLRKRIGEWFSSHFLNNIQ